MRLFLDSSFLILFPEHHGEHVSSTFYLFWTSHFPQLLNSYSVPWWFQNCLPSVSPLPELSAFLPAPDDKTLEKTLAVLQRYSRDCLFFFESGRGSKLNKQSSLLLVGREQGRLENTHILIFHSDYVTFVGFRLYHFNQTVSFLDALSYLLFPVLPNRVCWAGEGWRDGVCWTVTFLPLDWCGWERQYVWKCYANCSIVYTCHCYYCCDYHYNPHHYHIFYALSAKIVIS